MTLSNAREQNRDSAAASETTDEDTVEEPHEDSNDADTGTEQTDASHLEDVEVGAGCTEIWEHLAAQREEHQSEGGQ